MKVLVSAFDFADKRQKRGIIFCMVMAVLQGFLGDIAWAPVLKYMGDILPSNEIPHSNKIIALVASIEIIIVLSIIHIGCDYFTGVRMTMYIGEVRKEIGTRLFNKYMDMSFSYFDSKKTGEIVTSLDSDVETLAHILWTVPVYVIRMIASFIAGVVILWNINPYIILISIPISLFGILFEKVYCKKLVKCEENAREDKSLMNQFVHDKISGVRTVIAFGKGVDEKEHMENLYDRFLKSRNAKFWSRFCMNAGCSLISDITYILVLAIGGYFVIMNKMNMTDLMITYSYMYIIINPLYNINDIIEEFSVASVGYNKIMKVLNAPLDVDRDGKYTGKITGEISFNDVTFKYKDTEIDVLNDFSLDIQPGEYVAFVGSSGSGKSTIAGLIPRFYDIASGYITVDGVNIKDYDLSYLRKSIGIVQQETYLFNGSVYDNIVYGKENASMDEVIQAAMRANAHEFISTLQDGYNTQIGERGLKLSGGQRQRIAIARLFLSDPKVIILDEATSALDTESEREIQNAIDEIAKDRTVIAIAHRLSTIVNADKIYVLTPGGVVDEVGTHDELMEMKGRYYRLYQKTMTKK